MNLNDILKNIPYPECICNELDVTVNVDGFILPIENVNVKVRDNKIVLIISASSLEDREVYLERFNERIRLR